MKKKINVGIVGAGRWGPNLINALWSNPAVSDILVCDINENSLKKIRNKYSDISCTTSINSLTEEKSIDVVFISTPVSTHFDLSKKILNSGKHIFVEKPFCSSSIEGSQLINQAEEKGLFIMVGHVFLFNLAIQKIKEILTKSEIGKVHYLLAERTNLGPVRSDVNATWDLTSHDISIFNFLLNDKPTKVSTNGLKALDGKVEDTTFSTFKYSNGVTAHAHASWLNPRKVRQITIVGEKKMLVWDDLDLTMPIKVFNSNITLTDASYTDSYSSHIMQYHHGDIEVPYVKNGEPLKIEVDYFIKRILGVGGQLSDGYFGNEVVQVLEASDDSIKNNSTFIDIIYKR